MQAAPLAPAATAPALELVNPVRPVGLGPHPCAKRLPCDCVLVCDAPHDHAAHTARFTLDRSACTAGHIAEPVGERALYCACVLRAAPAEGARQVFVIDYARCTARSVPVPPTATPRP